ncbi:MAG TPA: CBS domain-containing protein [Candidatus Polarisedimenticolia bacterium]|nr:CBS domain-containing protein [Candidatus Polarisedimenticolia bacterium]
MSVCGLENVKAADIMTRDVVCLNEALDLRECEKILLDRRISGAPVVDDEGHLRGVLSKTDLVSHHYTSGGEESGKPGPYWDSDVHGIYVFDMSTTLARDIMTPVPCVASEWTTINELSALMARREVHRVVICRNRKVVGIVTSMDILQAIAKQPATEGWDPAGFPG